MVTVLIVEDSKVVSEYLEYIYTQDPEIKVIGNVRNGKEAIEFLVKKKPDVITMDIDMPVMDGLEATRRIMAKTPIPIVIVTASRNAREMKTSMEALASGALSIIEKPLGIGHKNEEKRRDKMIAMIKIMSEVKVITRKPQKWAKTKVVHLTGKSAPSIKVLSQKKIIAIGVSSGGPEVLKRIFSGISDQFPIPILVVQHIADGFLEGMVDWLNSSTLIPIQVAKDQEVILPGHIYFGPNNYQIGIHGKKRIKLIKGDGSNNLCPSVKHLFESILIGYREESIALLLTGMGDDGSKELKNLHDAGAATICQDEKSALVFGMPGVAVRMGAADYIMNPDQIGVVLSEIEKYCLLK